MNRIIYVFTILLVFIGCSTSMKTLEQYKADKDYSSIISVCGERTGENAERKKVQQEAFNFIRKNKDESKPHVIDAIVNGSGKIREGGIAVAGELPDRDFIDPLFKAYYDESDENIRYKIPAAWILYAKILDKDDKRDLALKIAATLEKEEYTEVLYFSVKALNEFAVPDTYRTVIKTSAEITLKKKKLKTSFGGAMIKRWLSNEFIRTTNAAIKEGIVKENKKADK